MVDCARYDQQRDFHAELVSNFGNRMTFEYDALDRMVQPGAPDHSDELRKLWQGYACTHAVSLTTY